jgi:hypothetical protein
MANRFIVHTQVEEDYVPVDADSPEEAARLFAEQAITAVAIRTENGHLIEVLRMPEGWVVDDGE